MQNEVLHHDGSERLHSPLAAAAILLGIYVAMYLAVGGIVELLTPPEAAARVAVRSAPTDRATAGPAASRTIPTKGNGNGYAD